MATLTTQDVTRAGITPTYAAASAGGDSFTPGNDVWLHVKNTNAASRTVTVDTPRTVIADVDMGNPVVTVPATTGDKMMGPFPVSIFAQTNDGLADITYSADAGVTVAVLKLTHP